MKKVLVVGGDKMSSIIDYSDRNTCVIFGDGCGCVLLEPNIEGNGVIDAILKVDGGGRHFLHQKAGGSAKPASHETVEAKEHYVYQEGQSVYKFAVTNMAEVSAEIMEKNNLTSDDVDWLVPHQANLRIIDATADRMGLTKDKQNLEVAMKENEVILLENDYSTKYEGFDPKSPESYIIFTLMQNIRSGANDDAYQRRWVWELLQNAMDTTNSERQTKIQIHI